MKKVRRLIVAVSGVAALVVGQLAMAPGPAQALPPTGSGIGWHYNEEGGGYVRSPGNPTHGGDWKPPPPDKDGNWWREEVASVWDPSPDINNFVWYCNPSYTVNCGGADKGSWSCGGLWPPDNRPALMHMWLRENEKETKNHQYSWSGPWHWEVTHDSANSCQPYDNKDWIPKKEIWKVNYDNFTALPKAKIAVSPPNGRTLVNLPTVVSTNYPDLLQGMPSKDGPIQVISRDPLTIRIPLNIPRPGGGLTGHIEATAGFHWTFQGAGGADGAGKPYDGTNPNTNPGHYPVIAKFAQAGTKTISLEVGWDNIQVFVDGLKPQKLDPFNQPVSQVTVNVVQSRAELGSG